MHGLWPCLAYLVFVVVTRAWFFLEVPVPALYGDSTSYYALVQDMDAGKWPQFTIRTPGYPLFLKVIFSLSNTLFAVVLAQTALTVLGGMALILAFSAYRRPLGWWASAAVGVYTVGLWPFEHDTAIMSDSPYASSLMFVLAFIALGVLRRSSVFWLLASLAMAANILIRPAGMFLFVIYVFCACFVLLNRYSRRAVAALLIPLPAIMLMLALYNLMTFGQFTLTAFGETQLAFATFTFWETDSEYPAEVNEAIERTQTVMRGQLPEARRRLLHESWNFSELAPIFLAGFHYPALDQASQIGGKHDYLGHRRWIRTISIDSIRKHPDLYAKFVATQLWLQFFSNIQYQEDFLAFLKNRVIEVYASGKYQKATGAPFYLEMAKEIADAAPPHGIELSRQDGIVTAIIPERSISRQAFRRILPVRQRIFASTYWVFLFFASVVAAVVRLALSRYRHPGAFISFVMTMSVLGANMVVALVEYGGHRYSFTTEYVYYLPVIVLPFLSPRPHHVDESGAVTATQQDAREP